MIQGLLQGQQTPGDLAGLGPSNKTARAVQVAKCEKGKVQFGAEQAAE